MPHFKCVGCKTRLHSAARPADQVGDLCPECGSLLEPVGELAEIVGFRSIKQRDTQRIADRLDNLYSGREALAEAIALRKIRPR
jgi:hypothetical protein